MWHLLCSFNWFRTLIILLENNMHNLVHAAFGLIVFFNFLILKLVACYKVIVASIITFEIVFRCSSCVWVVTWATETRWQTRDGERQTGDGGRCRHPAVTGKNRHWYKYTYTCQDCSQRGLQGAYAYRGLLKTPLHIVQSSAILRVLRWGSSLHSLEFFHCSFDLLLILCPGALPCMMVFASPDDMSRPKYHLFPLSTSMDYGTHVSGRLSLIGCLFGDHISIF